MNYIKRKEFEYMELSVRLKTVAQAVTPGNRVADVGTDHGYVPIYLVQKDCSPGGIAVDVNKGPLEKAQKHIQKEGLGKKIATRLGNGLAPIEPEETDTIVIAGMGGDLICKILKAKPEFLAEGKEFVLQPQSEWFKVRRLLKEYRYKIEKEWFLKEDGKYYVIIKAKPEKTRTDNESVTDGDMERIYEQYGRYLIETKNPVLKEYIEKEKNKKERIATELEKLIKNVTVTEITEKEKKNITQKKRRYQELQKEIADMKKVEELC